MKNIKISDYLRMNTATRSNSAEKNNIKNEPNAEQSINIKKLAVKTLAPIMKKHGICCQYGDWFRSKELNDFLGKRHDSQHTLGSAIDLIPIGEITAFDLAKKIKDSESEYNNLFLNYKKNKDGTWSEWVHIEYREDNLILKEDYTVIRNEEEIEIMFQIKENPHN